MSDQLYSLWQKRQQDRGVDIAAVKQSIRSFRIETPSWGYANSGTRFQVFPYTGAARTLHEKLDDAAQVHAFTGVCPTVAVHIPWDKSDDWAAVGRYAAGLGLEIGAVNPNLFQEQEYQYGSLTAANPASRQKAVGHMLECVAIMKDTGSKALSLWLADGTNYPGQGNFRARKGWLLESLQTVTKAMDDDMRILIEYKVFEPAFYHTDLADWGMAAWFAQQLGDKAEVLVDLGHHAPGTNVEHIVAFLMDIGKLGGFHFNNRKYADDDLIVGAINPYELFLIFNELVAGAQDASCKKCADHIAYMIDQSHNIEPKIPAMIRSVLNIQTAYAKALLVDRKALGKAQLADDVLAAEAIVRGAFEQDVSLLLEQVRTEMGLAPDPMAAYLASGYQEKIISARR